MPQPYGVVAVFDAKHLSAPSGPAAICPGRASRLIRARPRSGGRPGLRHSNT